MDGRVECNAGPLIALALIDRLNLVREGFAEVHIPARARDELLEAEGGRARLESALADGWLSVRDGPLTPDPLLGQFLDPGEAAVIGLAVDVRADWVLSDERKGRKIDAEIYGLNVVGTAGLLVQAKRAGRIGSVTDALVAMRGKGYWLADKIVAAAAVASRGDQRDRQSAAMSFRYKNDDFALRFVDRSDTDWLTAQRAGASARRVRSVVRCASGHSTRMTRSPSAGDAFRNWCAQPSGMVNASPSRTATLRQSFPGTAHLSSWRFTGP